MGGLIKIVKTDMKPIRLSQKIHSYKTGCAISIFFKYFCYHLPLYPGKRIP